MGQGKSRASSWGQFDAKPKPSEAFDIDYSKRITPLNVWRLCSRGAGRDVPLNSAADESRNPYHYSILQRSGYLVGVEVTSLTRVDAIPVKNFFLKKEVLL